LHFLLTGHTGFKGAWFIMFLKALGHEVSGIALDPKSGSLFERATLTDLVNHDLRFDIRDTERFSEAVDVIKPDFAIHFAAQALVRTSYEKPRLTFETNVNGTLNFLAGTENAPDLKGRLVITSDKVYRNDGRTQGYTESDPLGGKDPYSASKSMADILSQSWISSHPIVPSAIARAGNVIGGGDVAEHRIVPDIIEAVSSNLPLTLRYPEAVRPWQHVLDCLAGYSAIVDDLLGTQSGMEWNVGPGEDNMMSVRQLVEKMANRWGSPCELREETNGADHEEALLTLDSSALRDATGWQNKLEFIDSVNWTVDWEKSVRSGENPRLASMRQIEAFLSLT
jgi:CDP-glucose 4,6-dehydratase